MSLKKPALAFVLLFLSASTALFGLSAMDERLRNACWAGDLKEAQLSLEGGADIDCIDAQYGNTPLHLAVINHQVDIVKFLIQKKAAINAKTKGNGYTPAILAVFNNEPLTIKLLADAGANLDQCDDIYGNVPLFYASWEGYDASAGMLLDSGASVNLARKGDNYTALIHAAIKNRISTARILLEHGADPGLKETVYGFSALHYAAMNDFADLAKMLVTNKAPLNLLDKNLLTPLWHAANQNCLDAARVLVSAGADPFVKSIYGSDSYDVAVWRKNTAIADMIRKSVDPRLFEKWLLCFPLAGIAQRDFLAWNFLDLNPKMTAYPSKIDGATFTRVMKSLADSGMRAQVDAMNAYYIVKAGTKDYYASGPLSAEIRDALFVVMIGHLNGTYGELTMIAPELLRDYAGGINTYDGHIGMDLFVDDPERQSDGYPVFAAADGTVERVEPHTIARGGVDNDDTAIWIDHGFKRKTYYMHLRTDVLVKIGQKVNAGEQIAWVRPHSDAFDGHLHFGVMEWNAWVEPHQGKFQREPSRWLKQQDYYNGPAQVMRWSLLNGEGTRIKFHTAGREDETFTVKLSNSGMLKKISWKLFYDGKEVHAIDHALYNFRGTCTAELKPGSLKLAPGSWVLKIALDGRIARIVPFSVAAPGNSMANRPPEKPVIEGFESVRNGDHSIFTCSLKDSLTAADPDLDLVRYRYRWTVNGKLARNVLSLAGSDTFSVAATPGAIVTCSASAWDGLLESEAATVP